MMMIWSDEKYFLAMTHFFASNLDNHRGDFPDIDEGNNDQDDKRIGHKGYHGESTAEPESTSISEIKLCRLDIEPEKCRKSSTDDNTNS